MEKGHVALFIIYLVLGIITLVATSLFLTCTDPTDYRAEIQILVETIKTSSGRCITKAIQIFYGVIIISLAFYAIWFIYSKNMKSYKKIQYAMGLMARIRVAFLFTLAARNRIIDDVKSNMTKNFNSIPEYKALNAQNFLEKTYDCCGVYNFTDYNVLYGQEVVDYPETCCDNYMEKCTLNDKIKPVGCFDNLEQSFYQSILLITVLMILGFIIEIIAERMINNYIQTQQGETLISNEIPVDNSPPPIK